MRPLSVLILAVGLLLPSASFAFCGFFVGNTENLYSDATNVVLVRNGDQTVVSMRPDYRGPADDFAIVIPVPQVLAEADVRVLSPKPLETLSMLTAPRLVDYCAPTGAKAAPRTAQPSASNVAVKSGFTKGEYEILVLQSAESAALATWLKDQGYTLPADAEKYFDPYVQQGMYFFVAKVDANKVDFGGGRARLSPLQFRYTSQQFTLPIRLGLLNADGAQNLTVHIIGDSRYEAANRRNVFAPTNLGVSPARRLDFAQWYAATVEERTERPTMVTEYAWPVGMKCDPCPAGLTQVTPEDLEALGVETSDPIRNLSLVITRMHTRYSAASGTDDIVFQRAEPVTGGRQIRTDARELEQGAKPADRNAFQARFTIRQDGDPKACKRRHRGSVSTIAP